MDTIEWRGKQVTALYRDAWYRGYNDQRAKHCPQEYAQHEDAFRLGQREGLAGLGWPAWMGYGRSEKWTA